VLREDQKEWSRGVKTAEVMRGKEMRAMVKSVMDDKRRGTSSGSLGGAGGIAGFNDVDWQVSSTALLASLVADPNFLSLLLNSPPLCAERRGARREARTALEEKFVSTRQASPSSAAAGRTPTSRAGGIKCPSVLSRIRLHLRIVRSLFPHVSSVYLSFSGALSLFCGGVYRVITCVASLGLHPHRRVLRIPFRFLLLHRRRARWITASKPGAAQSER
jgi:hypothetical protein